MAPNKTRLIDDLEDPDSSLAKLLIKKWSWGLMSASEVHELACKALEDQKALLVSLGLAPNFASKSLTALSSLGAEGKFSGNMRRDLLSRLGDPPVPEPSLVRTPMKIDKPATGQPAVQEVEVSVFLPHEMLAYLYTHERFDFNQKMFSGDASSVSAFWTELERRGDPRLPGHPMLSKRSWRQHSIPISWHGDGIACIGSGKPGAKVFDINSWASVLGAGASLEVKLYCFGIMADNIKDEHSLFPIWRRVMWSLHWAFEGKWPTHDEDGRMYKAGTPEGDKAGTPLAGGYFLTLFFLKQDLDHLARDYHLADYRSNRPCELCPCHKDPGDWPMCFNNFSDSAKWMTSCYSAAEWNSANTSPHYLLQDAHMTCHNVEPDEAHVLHLGVGQYCLGSVLWMMVYACDSLKGTPAQNIERIWEEVRKDYKRGAVGTQMTNIKLKTFHNPVKFDDEYPRLKSKAAECKDLVGPVRRAWDLFRNPADKDHSIISRMLRQLEDMQKILSDNSKLAILPLAEAHKLRKLVNGFLKDYSLCANAADREKVCLFSVVPKHHWLWHLGQRAEFVNPRKSCCLLDESYIGQFKHVVAACSHGNASHNIQNKVAEQYRYGFFITCRYGL